MALYNEDIVNIELTSGTIHRTFLSKTIGLGDVKANRYGVRVLRNGQPVSLANTTCAGYFIRSTGETIPIPDGVVDTANSVAYVTLPATCYAVEGVFRLGIKVSGAQVTGTVRIVDGVVCNLDTGTYVDPGTILPDIQDLIDEIEAAVASIPADYSILSAAVGNAEVTGWADGYYDLSTGTDTVDIQDFETSTTYVHTYAACTPGDVFYVTSDGASAARSWAFLSSASGTGNVISRASSGDFENEKIIAPAGATYVVFNAKKSETHFVESGEKGLGDIIEKSALRFKGTAASATYGTLSKIIVPGIYYISSPSSFSDAPVTGATGSGNLVVYDWTTNHVMQVFTDTYGNERNRVITKADCSVYSVANVDMDTNGWYSPFMSNQFAFRAIYTGLTQQTAIDANNLVASGWYGVQSNSKTYVSNLPANTRLSVSLVSISKSYSGALVTMQYCIDQDGSTWFRLLNTSTHAVIVDWVQSVDNRIKVKGRWSGKTIVFFGDSRTWYDGKTYGERTKSQWAGNTCVGYQQQAVQLLGITATNKGASGETSAEICERIRGYNFSGADAVFLEGGVNDFVKASQVTIGTIAPIGSTFDTTTVYGAWQSAVEYIMTNYPQVKIFMDVPAIGWVGSDVFPYATAKVKKDVAELYNIPCLDLYKEAGISTVNRDYWFADDVSETTWRLHFNDYGNALVGQIVAKFIDTH